MERRGKENAAGGPYSAEDERRLRERAEEAERKRDEMRRQLEEAKVLITNLFKSSSFMMEN